MQHARRGDVIGAGGWPARLESSHAARGRSRAPAEHVLVVVGVRPTISLPRLLKLTRRKGGDRGRPADAHQPPRRVRGGRCVITHHRLLGTGYLPLGTTAHKQGGSRARTGGRPREFAGSLGTQVVKVFDLVAARTGVRDDEPAAPASTPSRSAMRLTITRPTTRAATRSRCATPAIAAAAGCSASSSSATATQRSPSASTSPPPPSSMAHRRQLSDLDLSYTPPLGSPWDAIQVGAQEWSRHALGASASGLPPLLGSESRARVTRTARELPPADARCGDESGVCGETRIGAAQGYG